jgi:hypothetical protein
MNGPSEQHSILVPEKIKITVKIKISFNSILLYQCAESTAIWPITETQITKENEQETNETDTDKTNKSILT